MKALAAILGWALVIGSGPLQARTPDRAHIPSAAKTVSEQRGEFTGHLTFRCAFSDFITADNGKIKPGGFWASAFVEANDNFTFDTVSGVFISHGDRVVMDIVRQGDSQSDWVAHVPGPDSLATIMRLQAYSKPITFFMVDHTAAFTGTCVKL